MPPRTSRLTFYIPLAILVLGAMATLYICTPAGVGLANDSVAYIAGARSILQGTGYSDIWLDSSLEAITHYPPLLSLTLTAIGTLGIDPLRGARILNILLFGANTGLLGLLGWRMTKSQAAGILLAALFVLNASLLRVHVFAMSEPLFLFFSLLTFLFFDFSLEVRNSKLVTRYSLLLTGFLTGLAFLTRYSGLALIATFLVALFLLKPNWRSRFNSLALFLAGAVPPMAAWFIRNKLAAGNVTNRTFQSHPITAENIQPGLYNFSQFLMPVETWRRALVKAGAIEWILAAIGLVLLVWLAFQAYQLLTKPQSTNLPTTNLPVSLSTCLPFTIALYIFAYLGAVLFSMSFFDASTKFQPRILAPIYVSLMVLFIGALRVLTTTPLRNAGQADTKSTKENLFGFVAQNGILRSFVVILVVFVLGLSTFDFRQTVLTLRAEGQGYASWQWHDSVVMAELKKLPAEVAIYTNTPPAVYLVTGRASRILPTALDPVDNRPRSNYEQNVTQMRADLLAGKAVLALFDTSGIEDALGAQNVAQFTDGLTILEKAQGDILYGK
jgi:4-amino-4-deoxy-L-arabinose transferase-like glycosyltransferase